MIPKIGQCRMCGEIFKPYKTESRCSPCLTRFKGTGVIVGREH